MLSLERCNSILQKHSVSLPSEEVQKIKTFLEDLARIQLEEENKFNNNKLNN